MANWTQFFDRFSQQIQHWASQKGTQISQWFKAQPRWKLALFAVGIPFLTAIFAVAFLTFLVWVGAFGALPDYAELKNIENYQASEIYSEDGAVLGKYYIENRTNASLDEIATPVIQALIATEDARFFEHSGVDLRALARVIFKSILLSDKSSGGGSTLSQQLAKNLFPRQKHGLLGMPVNKVREMFIAHRLESQYDKEDLLRMYLNTVPFGESAFGIKVAAYRFFNKKAVDLTVEEAALLVGMLKATGTYNPKNNPEKAVERRNVVLNQMEKIGYLEISQKDSLQALPLVLNLRQEGHNEGLATYFREHLRQELTEILEDIKKPDGASYNLYTDGLRIHTTIDSRLQEYAEKAVALEMPKVQARFYEDWKSSAPWSDKGLNRVVQQSARYKRLAKNGLNETEIQANFEMPVAMHIFDWKNENGVDTLLSPLDSIKYYLSLLNVGLLAAEPESGLIKAWVGGIDHRFLQYDHVKSRRPIGSTMKPVVFAAALQSGMLPCEYTENVLKTYEQFENWQPHNSDGEYGGAYSMAGALSNSVNTIAVELALRAGVNNVRNLAEDMGFAHDLPKGPAIALGAVDASLMEMVRVYSTFASRGHRPTKLHYLDRIETMDGEILVEFKRPNKRDFVKVLEPGHADMMLNMMQMVVDSGTARRLRTTYGLNGTIIGKTGTTQDQRDGWFMGFNSELVAGVWVGADHPDVHFRTLYRGQGSRTALPIYGRFMKSIYRDKTFRPIRYAKYEAPPDTVIALMKCPPHLPEMPVMYYEDAEYYEIIQWSETVEAIAPEDLEEILQSNPRRDNESLSEYSQRIRDKNDRTLNRRQRRENRKEFWGKVLFGDKKNNEGSH